MQMPLCQLVENQPVGLGHYCNKELEVVMLPKPQGLGRRRDKTDLLPLLFDLLHLLETSRSPDAQL